LNRLHSSRSILIFLFAVIILSACSPTSQGAPEGEDGWLVLQACSPQTIPHGLQGRAECGVLTVYEDRNAGEGRTIDLNIVRIPAVSRSPAPDPLVFLAGGPGQSAVESYAPIGAIFRRINQKRDILLVDQRGTGRSNPLNCPRIADDFDLDQDLVPWLESCLAGLDADASLYTTPIAMEDLDEVRQALGYEHLNLYGVSYGTRAALTYLRMHPERVRSMILDGVVPQDQALGIYAARDAQQSLNMIFNRCEEDVFCREAFPDISQTFDALLDTLDAQPVEVTLRHPTSGQYETLPFTRDMFTGAVRFISYTPETAALLPLLLHTAYTRDDFSLIVSQYLIFSGQLEAGIAEGMNYSVLCAEDVPFIDPQKAIEANKDTYLGSQQIEMLTRICEIWPRGSVPEWFKEPVVSDVPVLLLSGEMDPVTPPANGEAAASRLANSVHLVARGQGHNVLFRGCLPSVAASFIESGIIHGLNTECAELIQGAPFFLTFAGPAP
jgi:pimeloyl-ACP methyl ester carboxylesterase